jgi:short-subunit dehydrogenase
MRDAASHREVARIAAEHGQVAVWINNAGVLLAGNAWEHTGAEPRRC